MEEEIKKEAESHSSERVEVTSKTDFSETEHHSQERVEIIPETKPNPEEKASFSEKKEPSSHSHNDETSDEDISIDLSKVKDKFKNFLKSDEPKESHEEQTPSKNDEDDDISVDFSKVKQKLGNIFKSDEPKKKAGEKVDIFAEDKDDDISFDFSKIKNIFKKDKTKKESKDDDDLSVDFKKITDFTKKNSKWLIPLVLIILAISFSTYFRMMPANLPITDDWAQSQVDSFYRGQISQQINQQYPNLPQQNRDSLVEKEFQNFLKENKDTFKQQVAATSQQYKAQLQDENGQTYLLAIDPYLWYGEARNYINNGHFGTEKVDGEGINFLRNGREGKPGEPGSAFHLYFEVFLYKFFHFFNKNVSLIGIVFLVPVIIIGLSIIPAFLIGRKISGNVGGFFASLIVATNTALLSRTPAGFSDTDAYNIFFPLIILWLFLEAFDAKKTKNKLIYGILAGISVGLYSTAWGGWWYAFGFAMATLALYLLYIVITDFKKIQKNILSFLPLKNIFLVGITFFFSSALFVSILADFETFIGAFRGPLAVIALKDVATASLWPNVLTTVAEFNTIPLNTIISQMGGKLLFFIAVLGIVLTTIKKDSDGNRNVKYAIFLVIWFIGTAYGFTKGIRFGILMVPAFAISFGVGVGIIYQYASVWLAKSIRIDKTMTKVVIILLICLLLLSSIKAANGTARNEIPSMNDAWYNSLTKIKDNTTDAIITSWWDFGHWFVTIAERRVTFDGADQGERIHWVGKTLLTPDEQVSVGLLRMLNCGQEQPPHVLEEFFDGDTIKAVDVLNQMMVLNNKKEAIQLLNNEGLTNEQIAKIIAITYCDDLIEQFYITSEDMVGKAGVWGHFGGWDFERAAMYQETTKNKAEGRQILQNQFGLSEQNADEYYYQIINTPADQWVSTWPGYQGSAGCSEEGNILTCNIDTGQGIATLTIDLKTMNATIPTNTGFVHPNSLVYAAKEGLEEKKFEGDLMGVSAILFPENDQILMVHPLQAKSIFTQLFFFNGHGLECFDKFDEAISFNGQRIVTWKVDFSCQDKNKVYFLPKEEVHAAHILILTQDRTEEEALEIINSIKENITTTNFAEYVQKYSEDQGAAETSGDLGWFGRGQMVPEFEQVAFNLNVNQISEPVKTEFGYHLIFVQEKRES